MQIADGKECLGHMIWDLDTEMFLGIHHQLN